MKLVQAGKMDIDQPLVTYLPEFRIKSRFGPTDGITPRTILTHHSGLPGDWIDGHWGKPPQPFTELVKLIKEEYVAYPPDTVMSYSNLGVTLLGHAVQLVSGQEYTRFMNQCLLQPMGMEHSRFEIVLTGNHAAKAYKDDKEIAESAIRTVPSGGLSTSAVDLSRLAMLVNNHGKLRDQQIISPETLDTMFTIQNKELKIEDDFLVEIIHSSGGKYTPILQTVNSTEAIQEGLGRSFRETVRIIDDDEGNDILTFSGLRFKRVD